MISKGTRTQQKTVYSPFILHGALVGDGSLWPPLLRMSLDWVLVVSEPQGGRWPVTPVSGGSRFL